VRQLGARFVASGERRLYLARKPVESSARTVTVEDDPMGGAVSELPGVFLRS
jgi:hypothetical protein